MKIKPLKKLINSVAYAKVLLVFLITLGLASCVNLQKNAAHLDNKSSIFVLMQTSYGAMKIELYADKAPVSVANFLRYIDAGAYADGTFYRVVRHDNDKGSPKITVIQGGADKDFTQFSPIKFESTQQTGIKHLDGTLSMARLGPDTTTSDFFICVGAQPALDFGAKRHSDGLGFAAFGRVVKGMDIARRINQSTEAQPTDDPYLAGQMLSNPVVIQSIKRL